MHLTIFLSKAARNAVPSEYEYVMNMYEVTNMNFYS